jgi:4,5-epoxidase
MPSNVVVVGAGPTGLTLACALRAAGIDVTVVDAAAGPATTSRALGLQPRGVEVLDRLGALADLPDTALRIGQVTVYVEGRRLATLRIEQPMRRLSGSTALLMSQADIEAALRDRLAVLGGSIEWGRAVTAVDGRPDAVTVGFDDGSTTQATYVVGADGAHSMIRKAAGIGFPGVPLVERFFLADVHVDTDLPRDGTVGWLRGERLLAAMPLPGVDLWRLMAPGPPHYAENPGPTQVVDYLAERLAAECGGTVRSADWTSVFRIQRRLADTYRRGRVLIAGDAAHIHSPFGGQGMNTGMGDAENLAWKLALVIGGRAGVGLLDTYEAERRPIAKGVVASTSSATKAVVGGGRALRLLRDRVAVPLLNRGWVQRLVATEASQLRVSYRRGPLGARGRLPSPRPQPGDRVPNRECVTVEGTTIRLHDALGPQWALIGPQSLAEVARERLDDLVGVRVGPDGAALLVRPDGHLAWRGTDPGSLHAWLDTALGLRR